MLEFPGGKDLKAQKKIHNSRLQEAIESHSASTTSTAFGTINARRLIRERLESHPPFKHCQGLESQTCPNQRQGSGSHLAATAFSSYTNVSGILDSTPTATKALPLATFYSVDIAVAQASKIQHLLPAVYANILRRLWFV